MDPNDVKDAGAGRHCTRSRTARLLWFGGVLAVIGLSFVLGSIVGPRALAQSGAALGFGGAHCRFNHGAALDPNEAAEHARFAASWIVRTVNATDEQKEKVGSIAASAASNLVGLAPEHRQNREAILKALAAPNVDREALGKLEKAESALFDKAATRLLDGLADISETLTPEQRTELAQAVEQFHH